MVIAGNGKLLILILSPFAPTTSGTSKIIDIIAIGNDGTTFGVWQGVGSGPHQLGKIFS
jgi:hypothetical protein